METKFKKGDVLYSTIDFKKVVISEVTIHTNSHGEPDEETDVCYWGQERYRCGGGGERSGYREDELTKVDCTKELLKVKQLIRDGKFSLNIFDVDSEENKIIEAALKKEMRFEFPKLLDEYIKNSIE